MKKVYCFCCFVVVTELLLHISYITGVYLALNGTVYADKSVVQITEIGETDPYTGQGGGVQCITDRKPCFRDDQFSSGEWLFPMGLVFQHKKLLQSITETEVMMEVLV